ncbi:MAG: hypothetical protein R3B94_02080 [Hyphomonas sp.]
MAALFDAYIMVDWSAASKPVTGANSIWIGILAKDARLKLQFRAVNIDTRLKARSFLEDMVGKLTKRGDRVLLGFDFSLGYPAGTAEALGLKLDGKAPWQAMHEHLAAKLKDKPDNSNARYAIAAGMNYAISKGPFPFWGAPARDVVSTLGSTKPDFDGAPLPEYRIAETYLRDTKKGQPKSIWQLAYTGSVGSQSLTGIPHVHGLRETWTESRIWPFEFDATEPLTEESLSGVSVVMTEIYPSLIKVKPETGETADAAQVRGIAHHYASLDEKGALSAAFSTAKSLEEAQNAKIQAEEGWIPGI